MLSLGAGGLPPPLTPPSQYEVTTTVSEKAKEMQFFPLYPVMELIFVSFLPSAVATKSDKDWIRHICYLIKVCAAIVWEFRKLNSRRNLCSDFEDGDFLSTLLCQGQHNDPGMSHQYDCGEFKSSSCGVSLWLFLVSSQNNSCHSGMKRNILEYKVIAPMK